MRRLGIAALALVGAGGLFLWWGSTLPNPGPMERIRAACAAEFPYDLEGAQGCELRLLTEHLVEEDAARMDRARRAAG